MAEYPLGPIGQIPPGEGRNFDVAGLKVAVFRLRDGAVFATQADCPHRGGPLADGLTDNATVTCPLHDRVYDLASGRELGAECALAVHPIRVDGDGMMLLDPAPQRPNGMSDC